jgi:hypothetical protein
MHSVPEYEKLNKASQAAGCVGRLLQVPHGLQHYLAKSLVGK